MTSHASDLPPRPLRLWPGVVILAIQWFTWLVVPAVMPDAAGTAILGGVIGGLAIAVWWLFFSRAPWVERIGALVLMVFAVVLTYRVVHPSIANGMMGMMLPVFAIPVMSFVLVAWAAATRSSSTWRRRVALVPSIVLACMVFTLLRTDGVTGEAASDLHWRWTPTAEQRLLARAEDEQLAAPRVPPAQPAVPAPPAEPQPASIGEQPVPVLPGAVAAITSDGPAKALTARAEPAVGRPAAALADPIRKVDWPGFRGEARDGVIHGARIETDWARAAPVEMWRKPVGPGWSSFAVDGNLIFTQEQRGDEEMVSAYDLTSGVAVWRHRDMARFWESNAGPGPRGTPTLHNGRVYAFGGTGILNALNARDGSRVWSRTPAADTGKKTPDWGFASSPLIVDDKVVIATAGVLAAYDLATGALRWVGPKGGWGYSSPHLATVGGVPQIVLLNGAGAIGVAPADGTLLWQHEWRGDGILQPVVLSGSDVLIGSGSGLNSAVGVRRIAVAPASAGWNVEERWTSRGLKPYYNDFVVHKGHAFGFDGSILACIDLSDGARKWKGGRYGHGQLVLLPEQDLILVLSEEGELALVNATADGYTELSRFKAIEGKTWNHPVLVGNVLLVRNGEEMAAFKLPLAAR